jgi:biopolymer transport protein ExbD
MISGSQGTFTQNTLSQEVEVNITPVIDCFTVLITFLLASASFLSIGFFEAATPGYDAAPGAREPLTEIHVRIRESGGIELREKGKKSGVFRFSLDNPESVKGFRAELAAAAAPSAGATRILLSAGEKTGFASIAAVMEHLNETSLPVVIGDFGGEP